MKIFRKSILAIIALLLLAGSAFAVTNTRTAGGTVWSETAYWDQGHVPLAGEDVALGAQVVAVDVARIPATSGSLGTITASGAGQITIDLNVNGNTGLYYTTATAGTIGATGMISVSGSTANTLTIVATNSLGGTTSNSHCIVHNGTGTINYTGNLNGSATNNGGSAFKNTAAGAVIFNGNCTGGGNNVYGYWSTSTGAFTQTGGNITGGAGTAANGAQITTGNAPLNITATISGGSGLTSVGINNSSSLSFTFSGNLVDSTNAVAISGKGPTTWSPSASTTHTKPSGTWALVVAPGDLKKGVVNGTVTGTYQRFGFLP